MASFENAMTQLKEQLQEDREISELFDYRQSPFPARIYKVLEGTIDLHVHTIPDAYPRLLDDVEAVAQAKAVKMRAVVLKCHVAATPDRAFIAQRAVGGGIDVFGIICLKIFQQFPGAGISDQVRKMTTKKTSDRLHAISPSGTRETQHLHATLRVTPYEVLAGAQKLVNIPVGFRNRLIRITIPPGTKEGSVLRLKGIEKQLPDGTRSDIYLKISVDSIYRTVN